ncbi:MAG: hypothetical protein ACF8XB_06280 [Planctomycetota bacterium JB042]
MRSLTLTLVLLLTSSASPKTLVVDPNGSGDHTSLQAAIDAATAGDVLQVVGGTYLTITVDKPLTIVAEPRATIRPAPAFPATLCSHCGFVCQCPAVTLAGPGATGTVALVNLEIGGAWDGSFFSNGGNGIYGGGFAELHVSRCHVFGAIPEWITGSAKSTQAIHVAGSLPLITATASTIEAGPSDSLYYTTPSYSGRAAIDAPTSTVVLLDSLVRGGDVASPYILGPGSTLPPGPCPCPSIPDGEGGPGIVAQTLFEAGSVVLGGKGQDVYDGTTSSTWPLPPFGKQPDGPPTVVQNHHPLAQDLVSSGPVALGKPWTLSWLTPSGGGLLFLSLAAGVPTHDPTAGWLFLDPAPPLAAVPIAGGPGYLTLTVPADPGLLGLTTCLQAYDASYGLSRPVIEVVVP